MLQNTDNLKWEMYDFLRSELDIASCYKTVLAASVIIYLTETEYDEKAVLTKSEEIIQESLSKISDPEIKKFVIENFADSSKYPNNRFFLKRFLSNNVKKNIAQFIADFNIDEEVGRRGEIIETPRGVATLAAKFLDIQNSDEVGDMFCGTFGFIAEAEKLNSHAKYTGYEINYELYLISKIRSFILGENTSVIQKDLVCTPEERFDKIFCDGPMIPLEVIKNNFELNMTSEWRIGLLLSSNSTKLATWPLPLSMMDYLKEGGRACFVMPFGFLSTSIASSIRNIMLGFDSAYPNFAFIEGIVELPENTYSGTGVKFCLLILSKKKNKSIRIVNASDFRTLNRRKKSVITNDYINQIIDCYKNDSKYSKSISYEEIIKGNSDLVPAMYLAPKINFHNPTVRLVDIVAISRGAQLLSSELELITSEEKTNVRYLMLGNIQDGTIDGTLPYLKSGKENKFKSAIIDKKTLLIQKNGFPLKIAVVNASKENQFLISGNLFMLIPNESKVNVYYLKAFFESKIGQELLQRISRGTTIPTINMSALENLEIPLPPIEKQNLIEKKYLEKEAVVKELKEKLSIAKKEIGRVLEAEMGV